MTTLASLTPADVKTSLVALAAAHIAAHSGCLRALPSTELVTAAHAAGQLSERLDAEIGRRDPTACTLTRVLADVRGERARQDERWGPQNHPDGTSTSLAGVADQRRADCQRAAAQGEVTWRHILDEEIAELAAEEDPALLRAEVIQAAAVLVAWAEALDRREADRG